MADSVAIGTGANTADALGNLSPQDPNRIGNGTDFSFYVHGSASINNSFLLVVFVPNDETNIFPTDPLGTISVFSSYNGAITTNTPTSTGSSALATPSTTTNFSGTPQTLQTIYGLGSGSLTSTTGFYGDIESTSGSTKPGSLLGIGLSPSTNMSNVFGWASSQISGLSSSDPDFGTYVFLINTGPVPVGGLIDIQSSGFPMGSYLSAVTDNGDATPNTTSGGVDAALVPEPGSLALMGTGFFGLAILIRRKLVHAA